jgi:hypothetical protein
VRRLRIALVHLLVHCPQRNRSPWLKANAVRISRLNNSESIRSHMPTDLKPWPRAIKRKRRTRTTSEDLSLEERLIIGTCMHIVYATKKTLASGTRRATFNCWKSLNPVAPY